LNYDENLGELIITSCGLNNLAYPHRVKGRNNDLLSKLLNDCVIETDQITHVINTDKLLDGTGLAYVDQKKAKPHRKTVLKYATKLGYTTLGVALAVSGFYLWNWWKK
jgi:hypothetical protein